MAINEIQMQADMSLAQFLEAYGTEAQREVALTRVNAILISVNPQWRYPLHLLGPRLHRPMLASRSAHVRSRLPTPYTETRN